MSASDSEKFQHILTVLENHACCREGHTPRDGLGESWSHLWLPVQARGDV